MMKRLKQNTIIIALLVLLISQGGCAAHKLVSCHWRDYDITVNGVDNEWQNIPQNYDEDRKFSIRVTNDAEALFLCISTGDDALKRQLRMAGLTVWFDPQGGKEKIFGIHLPGGDFGRPHRDAPPFGTGALRPAHKQGRSGINEESPPPPEPLEELEITYKDTTGPLKMTMAEVRHTGIDIGVGQPRKGRLVYEFNIGFKAAPCLSDLKPGMVLGVGIYTGASKKDGRKIAMDWGQMGKNGPGGGMGGPGPGGGMGGDSMGKGSGGPRPSGKGNLPEVWLQVRLAGRASG